jgi:hypothetical protein
MQRQLKTFIQSQSGAVSVDWVVLCAGIVALAAGIVASMQSGTLSLSGNIASYLAAWSF